MAAGEPLRVRDVRARLAPDRTPAYTSVMTVLDNLFRKGHVRRELDGKANWNEPVSGREDAAVQAVLASTGDPEGVLLHFRPVGFAPRAEGAPPCRGQLPVRRQRGRLHRPGTA